MALIEASRLLVSRVGQAHKKILVRFSVWFLDDEWLFGRWL